MVLAESLYKTGKKEEAIECYHEILEIDSAMIEAWLDWSYIAFMDEQYDEAVNILEKAIEIDADCHQYHYRIACYLFAKGEIKQAKQHIETALEKSWKDYYLLYEIITQLQNNKEITDLIELYKPNDEKF